MAIPNRVICSVLRKACQEGKDEELGVHQIQDPIKSIQNLKYNVQYAGIIREIGLHKFYCINWSPLQMDIYKDIIKSNHFISIDATGSIVQKIHRQNQKSGAIFLYQAVASGVNEIVPLFQMLSEKHDANIIQYWLGEWLRSGGTVPNEVITDFSFALLNAVAGAFNNCNLSNYIKLCLKCLNYNKDAKTIVPKCFIRLDIAHIIKMIARWQCFHGKAPRIKDFYMRCIGFLTTIETKNQFENIFYSILVVALSECNDNGTNKFIIKHIRSIESICKIERAAHDNRINIKDNMYFYRDGRIKAR